MITVTKTEKKRHVKSYRDMVARRRDRIIFLHFICGYVSFETRFTQSNAVLPWEETPCQPNNGLPGLRLKQRQGHLRSSIFHNPVPAGRAPKLAYTKVQSDKVCPRPGPLPQGEGDRAGVFSRCYGLDRILVSGACVICRHPGKSQGPGFFQPWALAFAGVTAGGRPVREVKPVVPESGQPAKIRPRDCTWKNQWAPCTWRKRGACRTRPRKSPSRRRRPDTCT